MGRMCYMPFVNFESAADGSCTVCCKIPRLGYQNLIHDNIQDIWSSVEFETLRDKFRRGEEPEECNICWTEEATGNITTPRIQSLVWSDIADIKQPVIRYLTFKLSTRCNMACRICNPWLSSTWELQFEQLGWKQNLGERHQIYFQDAKTKKFNESNVKFLKETIPTLLAVNAYGGEPFLQEEFFEFLEWCKEMKCTKNITLGLTTNGSVINEEVLETMKKFKQINLHISVDDVFKRYEYNRWPVKWSKIQENLKIWSKYHDEIDQWSGRKLTITPTWSVLNIFYIEEILETLMQFDLPLVVSNFVHKPEVFSIRNTPRWFKDEVRSRINKIDFSKYPLYPRAAKSGHTQLLMTDHRAVLLSFLDLPQEAPFDDPKVYLDTLTKTLDPVDTLRGQKFKDYMPEAYKVLYDKTT